MSKHYDHKSIEQKWQKWWEENHTYEVKEDSAIPETRRRYILDMFPYPSAAGLHVGHPEGYTASDIYARYLRMRGYSVLHPMGWDAFGLPAENYAIRQGVHPRESTWKNIDNFRRQIKSIGFSYDWSREINTAEPVYYKWTQWFFLLLYKHGLAYRKKAPVNWCTDCQTVLAREQVVEGKCERCQTQVIQKELKQWFFKITDYAERLLADLDIIDWPEPIKLMQKNWIGRSTGAEIVFPVVSEEDARKMSYEDIVTLLHCYIAEKGGKRDNNVGSNEIRVFTTRPDTLFGATYMVIAPEHPLINNIQYSIFNIDEVRKYVEASKLKTELERTDLAKDKTGVELKGIKAVHPVTHELLPIWVADYVLISYGTGAIMAVPAHDERDFEFAQKYNLPIKHVIKPKIKDSEEKSESFKESSGAEVLRCCYWHSVKSSIAHNKKAVKSFYKNKKDGVAPVPGFAPGDNAVPTACQHSATDGNATPELVYQDKYSVVKEAYIGEGVLINSEQFNGLSSEEARQKITQWLYEKGLGKASIQYKLRDWLISRQRYWGAPIPIIYCDVCGELPVREEDLPVLLPDDVDFKPKGESPLARSKTFHKVRCPKCAKPARRESDTMDTFVCSSWYLYRYTDPYNNNAFASKEKMHYWLPIDVYVGGAEHAVMHLLYARFFCKVLYDLGYVTFEEPFKKLINQGLILAEDGRKMSKSLGNVINPDDIVEKYGADTLRMYEMFMGPLEDVKPWSTKGIKGIRRFVEKVWLIMQNSKIKMQNDKSKVKNEKGVKEQLNSHSIAQLLHKTIKKVTEDIEGFKFNTAISQLMIFARELQKHEGSSFKLEPTDLKDLKSSYVLLLAPFAPHLAEELWHELLNSESVCSEEWPTYDPSLIEGDTVTIVIQVNGKKRGEIQVSRDTSKEQVLAKVRLVSTVKRYLEGEEIKKEIYVENKIVNFVV